MEIFAADDKGSVHLCGDNSAGEDTTTDGDETGEGAFLVYGCTISHAIPRPPIPIHRDSINSIS